MDLETNIAINHELKILPEYFEKVAIGIKTFEIRKNDRDFKVGDTIFLREFENGHYGGRNVVAKITYITDYEQKEGYVVFGIQTIKFITWLD